MKFLIQGIGSIGQRHYKNARALGHEAAILRASKDERPFVRDFFEAQRKEGNEPAVFYSLDDAVREFAPDGLVVCTPNHRHLSAALEAAERGLHLLIEKPVHDQLDGLQDIQTTVEEKKLVAMVGYNLRFHPLLAEIKRMVSEGELGAVLSAAVEVGENIEDWHPWEDYRDTYAPWVRSGGGALLCFSHDIDYLYWIMGMPSRVSAAGGKVTPLSGDAEDLVQGLWGYDDGRTATLHIDYWQRPKVRTLKVIGTAKTAVWDAYGPLTIYDHASGKSEARQEPEGFERNDMFLDEMRHFADCIAAGKEPLVSLGEAVAVLMCVAQIKDAISKK